MPKRKQGIAYRIWNQTRLAMHMDSQFQIYKIVIGPEMAGVMGDAAATLGTMSQAQYQTMIVHLDMIRSHQGVSLEGLIREAARDGLIDAAQDAALRSQIATYDVPLRYINRQRNNLVAHRSDSLTFKMVRDAYPVTTTELGDIIAMYYKVSTELGVLVPFKTGQNEHANWRLHDQRPAVRRMLEALKLKPDNPLGAPVAATSRVWRIT